jgi:quercetin dioxygenase-like cupin family protein
MAVQLRAQHKSLDKPDEKRTFPKGRNEIVNVGGRAIGRLTLEPGWRWSLHVKPQVGTASCKVEHLIYVAAGRLASRMDSGEEFEIGPGEVGYVPAGHDGWVVGKDACVVIEMAGAAEYAKPR